MTTIERRRFEESLFNTWKRRAETAEDFLSCAKNLSEQIAETQTDLYIRLLRGESLLESEGLRKCIRDLRFWTNELHSVTTYKTGITT